MDIFVHYTLDIFVHYIIDEFVHLSILIYPYLYIHTYLLRSITKVVIERLKISKLYCHVVKLT